MLDQEGGVTLEQLLMEDEHCLSQCKAGNQRLTDFMCQRETLQKLIKYATKMPTDPNDHAVAHKFPFVAADILTSSKLIATSLVEGGSQVKADDSNDDDDAQDDIGLRMVSDSLKETNEKAEKKETVVEELDIEGGEKSDKVTTEEPAHEDDDCPKLEEQEDAKEPEKPKLDTSLLDLLIDGFSETYEEDMLPVLCGYFNKIISSLISKERQRMLEYLLLKRGGAIFDSLMRHINHHSLALLLIELLNVQIKPETSSSKKSGGGMMGQMQYEWETSDQENNDDAAENEGTLTPEQEQMQTILQKKSLSICLDLLDALSNKNNDLEKTLNANTVLFEFCDNDHCFAMLTNPEVLNKLIKICCQATTNVTSLSYALNLLQTIIKEFGNNEKEISDERKQQIQMLFVKHFPDMAYNCILILTQATTGAQTYVNQS